MQKLKLQKNTPLSKILRESGICKRCNHCCKYGTGFMINGEEEKIAKFLNISVKELDKYLEEQTVLNTTLKRPKTKKKPFGPCIFLTEKGCSIHKVKPLQCKIGNCSSEDYALWFMLNYQLNTKDPQSLREYAVYLELNGKTLEGGQLADLISKKELQKIKNYEDRKNGTKNQS